MKISLRANQVLLCPVCESPYDGENRRVTAVQAALFGATFLAVCPCCHQEVEGFDPSPDAMAWKEYRDRANHYIKVNNEESDDMETITREAEAKAKERTATSLNNVLLSIEREPEPMKEIRKDIEAAIVCAGAKVGVKVPAKFADIMLRDALSRDYIIHAIVSHAIFLMRGE